ncbi:MAG: SDR family oxidoreductase [Acidiferrobacterales bacterium]|nr:SDR family oxidoreductase [Acidiferrobacterales bacterium]
MNALAEYAVITGAGSGIGRAVAIELSKEPLTILAIGRRLDALKETAAQAPGEVLPLSADVATEAGRTAILAQLGASARVRYLVHGAGILPIERLSEITLASWRAVMETNVEARLFLTQALIPHLRGGGRVLFIGSMSATRARKGSTAYCTALAASFMLQQCLQLELAGNEIKVTSAVPGPVKTVMIENSLSADADVFPDSAEYAVLRDQGKLIEPQRVGEFYRWLLTRVDDNAYSASQWDIRDESHHRVWLGTQDLYEA